MKCTLRNWRNDDAQSLADVLCNKAVLDNLRDGLPFPYTNKDALEYINAMNASNPDDTFAYAVDIEGIAVGSIAAFRQSNIHYRTAELGYYLAQEYWRQGIMTEAVCQLCAEIFEKSDILRIYAEPFECNIGSKKVLEKAGFELEGVMKANAVKNGMVLNTSLYAMTRNRYTVLKSNEEK